MKLTSFLFAAGVALAAASHARGRRQGGREGTLYSVYAPQGAESRAEALRAEKPVPEQDSENKAGTEMCIRDSIGSAWLYYDVEVADSSSFSVALPKGPSYHYPGSEYSPPETTELSLIHI